MQNMNLHTMQKVQVCRPIDIREKCRTIMKMQAYAIQNLVQNSGKIHIQCDKRVLTLWHCTIYTKREIALQQNSSALADM